MSNYIYQAVDGQGTIFHGTLKANGKNGAAEYLLQQELFIIKLEKDYWGAVRELINNDFDERELILLFRQLNVMVRSGIPLGTAFSLISKSRNKKDKLTGILQNILKGLQEGSSFSNVLAEAGDGIFPKPMIAGIAAGEASGTLDEVLEKETSALSRSYQSKTRFKTAMIYPMFLLVTSCLIVVIMMMAVLPVFSNLFHNMNVTLPLPTRMVLAINDIMINYGFVFPFIGAVLFICFYWVWKNEKYQLLFYKAVLEIPIIGRLLSRLDLEKWLETMALLLKSGVVLIDSLIISSEVINNSYLRLKVKNLEMRLRRGEILSQVSKNISCIDGFIIELMRAGEISGELPEMLSEASLLCSLEANTLLKRIEAMLEPAIILVIGIVTGFLVISILMPVMEMMTLYS